MNCQEQSDETLVALTLAGHLQAYEKLILRHQRNVYASAYSVVHDHYAAEDAAQEAFVTAWRKLNLLNCPSKYGPWVCRISANRAKNMLASSGKCLDIELLETIAASPEPDMAESIIIREEQQMLRSILEKLPLRTRQVLCLYYFDNLPIKDIAGKMLISSGTVKWQLHEGRTKLRKELYAMQERENGILEKGMIEVLEQKENAASNEAKGKNHPDGNQVTVENLSDSNQMTIENLSDLNQVTTEESSNRAQITTEESSYLSQMTTENLSDSNQTNLLSDKVMNDIKEIQLWRLRNNRDGFQEHFQAKLEEILADLENLPESELKYHILADILMEIWNWVPEEDNDAFFARLREAAIEGKNEAVMECIISLEDCCPSEEEELSVSFLEEHGFVQSLGKKWFWLGQTYFRRGDAEKGFSAYDKVLSILEPKDVYYAFALVARQMEKIRLEQRRGDRFLFRASGEEYRFIHKIPRRWLMPSYETDELGPGGLLRHIFLCASSCDCYFYIPGLKPGETYTATDGSTLTFAEENLTVETPCGTFQGCQCWIVMHKWRNCRNYYKEGVGLVRQECLDGTGYAALKSCQIEGGEGLMPFCTGNRWVYELVSQVSNTRGEEHIQMTYADEEKAVLGYYSCGKCNPCPL